MGNPGGIELRASSSTRCLFSYIPQGNTMFSGTIADNMRMVKPDAADEEIRAALEAACAWDFVERRKDRNSASPLPERFWLMRLS